MIKIANKSIEIQVPTKLSEIGPAQFEDLFGAIRLPDDYCIIAILNHIKLSQFAMMSNKSSKETLVYTTNLVAKLPESHHYAGEIEVGDKVILTRSNLEMGTGLSIDTMISAYNLSRFINDNDDIRLECIQKTIGDDEDNTEVWIYVLEAKILPMCDIKGTVKIGSTSVDPFSTMLD